MKTKSYKKDIARIFTNGVDRSSTVLNIALLDSIRFSHFWKGFENSTTYRKSGEIVIGAYRTITDLENLLDSQNMNRQKYKTIWDWDGNGETPPQVVYFGTRTIPGRDWVGLALSEVDLGREFKAGFLS